MKPKRFVCETWPCQDHRASQCQDQSLKVVIVDVIKVCFDPNCMHTEYEHCTMCRSKVRHGKVKLVCRHWVSQSVSLSVGWTYRTDSPYVIYDPYIVCWSISLPCLKSRFEVQFYCDTKYPPSSCQVKVSCLLATCTEQGFPWHPELWILTPSFPILTPRFVKMAFLVLLTSGPMTSF